MILVRRVRVRCHYCEELLVQRENETNSKFKNRKTCNADCASALKARNKNYENFCFCGKPRTLNSPYCSWEHRLIAGKCKQWGIELSLRAYCSHSEKLMREQRALDDFYRNR